MPQDKSHKIEVLWPLESQPYYRDIIRDCRRGLDIAKEELARAKAIPIYPFSDGEPNAILSSPADGKPVG